MSTHVETFYAIKQVPAKRGFSTPEAAEYIGVSEDTLIKIVDRGHLKCRRRGRYRLFDLRELDRYLEELPEWE